MARCFVAVAPGVRLAVEWFGDPADPAIVLLGGISGSMDWWEPGFCERLAAGGRSVARFDWRDTGESTTWPAGHPGYTAPDLLADVLALLDDHGVRRGHIVGLSMGGGLAQLLAIEHPERVATLTLMSTGPGEGPDLPPPESRLRPAFELPAPDWFDPVAVVDHLVTEQRYYAGTLPFDEPHVRAIATRVVARSTDMEAAGNHALITGGGPIRSRLGRITASTLVLHGTDDPLFPVPHGEALAAEIPDAGLILLDGVGHEYPPPEVWDVVTAAILTHTAA